MAENRTLARPYAQAAFELAQAKKQLDDWSGMLHFIGLLAQDEQIARLVHDPRISSDKAESLLLDITGKQLNDMGKNFLRLLVANRRLDLAPQIAAQYEELKAKAQAKLNAQVISAFKLDSKQLDTIGASLKKKFQREIEMENLVEPNYLGGVVVRIGDQVIDGSARGRLQALANQLTS